METQTAEHTLANIILHKEGGKTELKGLIGEVAPEQQEPVMRILAEHYIEIVDEAVSSELNSENMSRAERNLEKIAQLAELGLSIDKERIDYSKIREDIAKRASEDSPRTNHLNTIPALRRLGVHLRIPELADAGYKYLEKGRSKMGPAALIAAYQNGEQIDHARVIGLAREIHDSYPSWGGGIDKERGALKFLRIISALKEGINLDVDVPEILNEVGFSLQNFDRLCYDVLEMPEHLIKLGQFKASEFERIILNEAEGITNFYEYRDMVFNAFTVLESVEGYEFSEEFMKKVYTGFKSALKKERKSKQVTWFLEATKYFKEKGIEPDMEGLALAESRIHTHSHWGNYEKKRLMQMRGFGYPVMQGIVRRAFSCLENPDDRRLRTAFWALETLKNLDCHIDADRVVSAGVSQLEKGTYESMRLGMKILAKAKELYGARPEPAIARLLDYKPE
jgi:hypothetical protein